MIIIRRRRRRARARAAGPRVDGLPARGGGRSPKSYPLPRLQDLPTWKKRRRKTKNSLASGIGGVGISFRLLQVVSAARVLHYPATHHARLFRKYDPYWLAKLRREFAKLSFGCVSLYTTDDALRTALRSCVIKRCVLRRELRSR